MDTPKYERLKQVITNNIRDGIWKPGDKLPAEKILCEQFGVSKITVKKAKDDLLAEGILENLPGRKGTFIKPTTRMPSTGLVGVAIDDIQDPYFSLILKGIEDKLWEHKLHTIVCNVYHDFEKIEAYFQSLSQRNVAGIIFAPARGARGAGYIEGNHRIIDMLTENRIPYILVDRYIPGLFLNTVVSNNLQSSKEATKQLLNKGHKRILVLTGVECSSINERLQGHLEALQEAEIDHDPHLIIRVDDLLLQGQNHPQKLEELKRIRGLVEKAGDFTACYTLNSTALRTFIRVIFPRGRESKKSFEIATHDYSIKEVIGITNRVMVVKQPGYRMGWEAARLLIETLNNPDLPIIQMILQSEIIEEIIK